MEKDPFIGKSEKIKIILDKRIERIKAGLFAIYIMIGDTRTGKSTLSRKMAWYTANALGVPISVKDNVHFFAEDLLKAMYGKNKQVFILDESSNDLLAADRGNKFQLQLIKYINTAAKYNQTLFILLPNLGQLKKDFLISSHVFGFKTRVCYDETAEKVEDRWVRGRAWALSHYDLLSLHDMYRQFRYKEYMMFGGESMIECNFSKEESFMTPEDYELYETKKDAAINKLNRLVEKKEKKSKRHIKEKDQENDDL